MCSHVVVLRKGQKLYAGRVDEMTSSNGFFEMKTKDLVALEQLLMVQPQFGRIKVEGDLLTAFLSEPMEAASVNKLLFEKGIVLSHLVKRKESLEEQFLSLTNNH